MKNKTSFNWKCPSLDCNRRNIVKFDFQFQVPQNYTVEVTCSKCQKDFIMHLGISVETPRRKKKK